MTLTVLWLNVTNKGAVANVVQAGLHKYAEMEKTLNWKVNKNT